MSIELSSLDFIYKLQQAYIEKREFAFLYSALDPDILWDCLGSCGRGAAAVEQILRNEQRKRELFSTTILSSEYQTQVISEEYCLVYGEVRIRIDSEQWENVEFSLWISALCMQCAGEIKLRQMHMSYMGPHDPQWSYASFRETDDRERSWFLKKLVDLKSAEVEERDRDLQTLTENIPGGMFRCLYDEHLTIQQMSSGFLSMFGYTREEIRERFHDSFFLMIDPRDRQKALDDAKRQMAVGTSKELEYRVLCRDGSALWVLDKGQLIVSDAGQESFCCIVVDITKAQKAQEALKMSLERHQIIMNQTNDILFEWDIAANRLIISNNWEKKFGYKLKLDNEDGITSLAKRIVPEDRPTITEITRSIMNGKPYNEEEIRIMQGNGDGLWCRLRTTTQFDETGKPVKAVGVIVDIDDEKKRSQKLLEKAERDALTKLYNKGATQNLIGSYLDSCDATAINALMIIDVDNFKQVNDSQGHLFGDAVLTEIAEKIQKLFRTIDVIGRVGGDEFIVFLKGISTEEVAHQKADQIIAIFQEVLSGQKRQSCQLSCSIGIALYPYHGLTFQQLYQKADHALYRAKKQGKNQYVTYSQQLDKDFSVIPGGIYSVVNEQIDSDDEAKTLNSKLVEYVFRILYKSLDVEAAVDSLLEIVGRQFDVSRAYIFENTEDDLFCSNTFEWCNEGVLPEIDNLQKVSYKGDLGGDYFNNFNDDGIFYCRDITELPKKHFAILEPQGIKSILQCAIRDNGRIRGYVGFDECRMNRFWTQEQVDALAFISEILSTFLLKKRVQDRLQQTAEDLLTVLDNQNSWIYVVNSVTYEMYFINRKTKELVPDARLGMRCYESFFHRREPCDQCPMREIPQGETSFTMEVYNPILHVWSSADASTISWKGKKACLLSCHDITKYKQPEGEK